MEYAFFGQGMVPLFFAKVKCENIWCDIHGGFIFVAVARQDEHLAMASGDFTYSFLTLKQVLDQQKTRHLF